MTVQCCFMGMRVWVLQTARSCNLGKRSNERVVQMSWKICKCGATREIVGEMRAMCINRNTYDPSMPKAYYCREIVKIPQSEWGKLQVRNNKKEESQATKVRLCPDCNVGLILLVGTERKFCVLSCEEDGCNHWEDISRKEATKLFDSVWDGQKGEP